VDGYAIASVHPATVDAKGRAVACRRVYPSGRVEWLLADGSTAIEPITSPHDIAPPGNYNVGIPWLRSA